MKEYFMICFRGCLNGEREVFIDLCVIELDPKDRRIHFMFQYNLISYLYEKRGKGELGPKNGPRTNGWIDVLKILKVPEEYKSDVIKMESADLNEVYRTEKIKIKKKGE